MSFADNTFKELRHRLAELTDKANGDDLNHIKMICDEYSELIDTKLNSVCPDCNGEGETEMLYEVNGRDIERTLTCSTCRGTGKA